jgi:ribosomal protein S26
VVSQDVSTSSGKSGFARGFGGFLWLGRISNLFIVRFLLTGHSQRREEVEHFVVVDQVDALGAKTDEVRAVFAAVSAYAVVYAKKIGVGAVDALSQGHAHLRHGYVAGRADGKEIFADDVMCAALKSCVPLDKAEYSAPHVDMRVAGVVFFDLLKALVYPVYTVPTINHWTYRFSSCALPILP